MLNTSLANSTTWNSDHIIVIVKNYKNSECYRNTETQEDYAVMRHKISEPQIQLLNIKLLVDSATERQSSDTGRYAIYTMFSS